MTFERLTKVALLAAALCLGSQAALAHHSVTANFNRDLSVEITGTLVAFHLRNPHSQLEVDVVDEDGTVTQWLVEWGTRNDLIRRGVDVDSIKEGEEVTVTMIPSRRLEHVGYARSLVLADGSTIRDCGYTAFRDALLNPDEVECEAPER
jgi:hypothetical protein